MKGVLLFIAMSAGAPELSMPPEVAMERWRYVTHLCWEGTNVDGEAIDETTMKVACITAGVLTAHLVSAGYCLQPRENEWKPCG